MGTSAGTINLTHVAKLDDSNYQQCRLQVSLVLKAADVWDVVDGSAARPTTPANQPAWITKDTQAQAIMVPTLTKSQTNDVYKCNSAKEMYDRLRGGELGC